MCMKSNRLINEKSPYLLQHAHNPVDWYTWSEEAFKEAIDKDKPIFLSIGYSTCHWCHVMEKESFEDIETAKWLNDTFICIKVDREERPDIDAVYMSACYMLTGGGGWPLTIFMTHDKKPFFAATYLPKHSVFNRPGIIELCKNIKKLWFTQKSSLIESSEKILTILDKSFIFNGKKFLNESIFQTAYSILESNFDAEYGGFLPAPKFPVPHRLIFLMRYYKRTGNEKSIYMVNKTLEAMRIGGIWDHVGFGFHRYSTDKKWIVPHFEKMLYDQALLCLAYVEAYSITKNNFYSKTCSEILTYVFRDMISNENVFYSAEDADSEGEEGKFYVWKTSEIEDILGKNEVNIWKNLLNLKDDGNFTEEATLQKTGTNILYLTKPLADELNFKWEGAREKLCNIRKNRIHPFKDDKILTDWNGLMIATLSLTSRILNKIEYMYSAKKTTNFILKRMISDDGRLMHSFRNGEAGIKGNLNDYAFFIMGLIELYASTFEIEYLQQAINFQKIMIDEHWDKKDGGFFITSENNDDLPVRPKELYDGAIPSANSISFLNLLKLSKLTGNKDFEDIAKKVLNVFSEAVSQNPSAYTQFLISFDFYISSGQEIVIAGEIDNPQTQEMISLLNNNFNPHRVVIIKTEKNKNLLEEIAPFTKNMKMFKDAPCAYVCKNFTCNMPVNNITSLLYLILK
ncbi:MAG: thioredoxin domain-containing protein [Desulfobacterales bacterium]|nr:thioredoxin domain-containing protein [Desulfobacterales bacterium]